MKKKMIMNKIKELFYDKKKLKIVSIIVVAGVVSVILVAKGSYIKSVVDGDPGYLKLKNKVALFAYRKTVSLKEFEEGTTIAKDDEKSKGPITAASIKGGFDDYTPNQIVTADLDGTSNNFNYNNTNSISNNGINNDSNKNNNIEEKTETKTDNSNKEEIIVDKSSFTGKDVIISEGNKFDPFETLQLSAKDVDGKNITKKIVIKENNVDVYKPGLYTVKASVELNNGKILEKEFLIRVEPVKLQLAVNDIELSKDVLQKKESYTLNFKVDSSKDYIDVASVNINGKMYYPNKTTKRRFFSKEDIYSIQLVASDKAGIEDINFNTITMTDGSVIDINQSKSIEILKEEATIKDMVIENADNNSGEVKISFLIKDIDNTINEAKLYVYDEEENVIVEKEVEKNKTINSVLNVNKNGVYKIRIVADEKVEFVSQNTKESKRKELYSTSIEVNNARFSDESLKEANLELASYVVYNDEEDFISRLSFAEIKTGDVSSDIERPSEGDSTEDSDAGNNENTQNPSSDKFIENTETNYKRGYTTSDKLHVVIPTRGKMTQNSGTTPQGRLNVTVPTTASFTVKNNSDFIGTSIKVTNNGENPVDVSVANFIDVDGDEGIKLVTDSEVDTTKKRNEVNLWLENKSENKKLYLGNRELYSSLGSTAIASNNDQDKRIAKVLAGTNSTIDICGKAGTSSQAIEDPISNRFTLILKIKKSTENGN